MKMKKIMIKMQNDRMNVICFVYLSNKFIKIGTNTIGVWSFVTKWPLLDWIDIQSRFCDRSNYDQLFYTESWCETNDVIFGDPDICELCFYFTRN